jgi:NADH-quinone oxidoreductase subunit G
MKRQTMTIDNTTVSFGEERNLLEVIRKAHIELPTFCYHSEMSIYGACRLCMVEVEGMGMVPACSTLPTEGMVVHTTSQQIRKLRKMVIELLLASHVGDCPSCSKGPSCQLQKLGQRLGVDKVRFPQTRTPVAIDVSSPSLLRDPNKCVLCGDCVRMCNEIQTVGAIDFAYRGSKSTVMPCFGKNLGEVECVNCGQCARVCPTGALVPRPNIDEVWKALHDSSQTVVAQVAPAVRVALGEAFGMEPGTITTGRIVAALRRMGFDRVYDTSFTADLTILEEAEEFLERKKNGQNLPQFTSCCPAWVKFTEQYYPEYLGNLSTCSSPQQMMGALCKASLKKLQNIPAEKIVMVSIMPCTAKKYEARRPEHSRGAEPDVDLVLTTQELILMIKESGLVFDQLDQESFDMPFGFTTGGGVIFGNSGGVTEAVLRYAAEKITGRKDSNYVFKAARGPEGLREFTLTVEDTQLSVAVVSGLGNAREVLRRIQSGEKRYDLVEVMACPGGCMNGGGQPISSRADYKEKRTCGLYDNDKMLQLHKPQENPYIAEAYEKFLQKPGSHVAHDLLHTTYSPKRRTSGFAPEPEQEEGQLEISICFGTSCFLRGAQQLYSGINAFLAEQGAKARVSINATFCYERCDRGPVVKIGEEVLEHCTLDMARAAIRQHLAGRKAEIQV